MWRPSGAKSCRPAWRFESPQRVAVLGPEGTFCEQAAIEFFGGAADLMYCANFDEVFHATAAAPSTAWWVLKTPPKAWSLVHWICSCTPTHVVGEMSLLVRHNLLRTTNSLDNIEAVLAHPQALAQCQAWLSKHLPHAERRPVSSNAEGARLATTNPAWAALSSNGRPASLARTSCRTPSRTMRTTAHGLPSFACRTRCRPHHLPAKIAPA